MKIFLAGAAGFVGMRVLRDSLAAGHSVTALVHSDRSRARLHRDYPGVTIVLGDISNSGEMRGIVPAGTEAVIYLPGLLREFPKKGITFKGVHVNGVRSLIEEAKRVGARRWIQMSALGAGPEAKGKYYRTKWRAEELVRASGLDWTVVRPSVIFDDQPTSHLNFVSELANVIRKAPILPVFGNGRYRLQPVSLDDVSQTIVQAIAKPETVQRSYELGGPEKLAYIEILRVIAGALGKRRLAFHIHFFVIEQVTRILERFAFYPLTMDQLRMLKAENIIHDPRNELEWKQTFTLPMKRFEETIRKQLR